jgi:hypothetical protein
MREFVASVMARWLNVRVPAVELYIHPAGPAALSIFAGQTVLTWGQAMNEPVYAALRPMAIQQLAEFTGVLVLDILVGAQDRANAGNAIYIVERGEWYGIDYSFSFGLGNTTGVGDPNQPYDTSYLPEFMQAIPNSHEAIKRSAAQAELIPESAVRELLAAPPLLFATPQERADMANYILNRRSRLQDVLTAWCGRHGLGSVTLT